EGDRDGRSRLGVDRLRLGRGPAVQLHRRRAEHVPDLEHDAVDRARRVRARVLPRLPDRPRVVHRRVLREPRLGCRERVGRSLRNSDEIEVVLGIVVGYLAGSVTFGYWLIRIFKHEDVRKRGSGNVGATNVWRTYGPWYGVPVVVLDTAKGFVPAFVFAHTVSPLAGVL